MSVLKDTIRGLSLVAEHTGTCVGREQAVHVWGLALSWESGPLAEVVSSPRSPVLPCPAQMVHCERSRQEHLQTGPLSGVRFSPSPALT